MLCGFSWAATARATEADFAVQLGEAPRSNCGGSGRGDSRRAVLLVDRLQIATKMAVRRPQRSLMPRLSEFVTLRQRLLEAQRSDAVDMTSSTPSFLELLSAHDKFARNTSSTSSRTGQKQPMYRHCAGMSLSRAASPCATLVPAATRLLYSWMKRRRRMTTTCTFKIVHERLEDGHRRD